MNIIDYIKQILSNGKQNAQIYAVALEKDYNTKEALEIGVYNNKSPIANEEIGIEINNKQYIRTTDENGIARLNINLPVGKYTAKIYWRGNKEFNKVTAYTDVLIVTGTYLDGINLTKNEGDTTPYQCALYRRDNNERIRDKVNITINGVTYVREADNDGLYKLNINLGKGIYPLKAEFKGNQYYKQSDINNTITINEKPPEPEPTPTPVKTYEQELLDYFNSVFDSNVGSIDEALELIQGNGYGYYYDDMYSNYTSINRMANGQGVNCTDSCQVFFNLGVALGYEVHCLHIGCSGGDGHVRLKLRHDVNTDGEWIYRDPASVLNGNSINSNWCSNGTLWDVDPDWFMANLYR